MAPADVAPVAASVPVDVDVIPVGRPLKGPQSAAYLSLADELFYGGAGGGGKTFLELLLALNEHRATVIFRREYEQFKGPGGIIEEARKLIGERGKVTQDGASVGDRQIEWGAMKDAGDWVKWRGRPHDLLCFDELPEFLEIQYRSVIAWLRSTEAGQRVRVVTTGNPPNTPEGEWVVRYWAPWLDPHHPHPAKPGELRWFAVVDGKDVECPTGEVFVHQGPQGPETIRPRSRTFIPASVEDNPILMATGYDQVLNSLPEPLRSQMRYGRFDATMSDDARQVIPTAWVRAAQARWTAAPPMVAGPGGIIIAAPLTAVGGDISRGGADKTTIACIHGRWAAHVIRHAGTAVPDGLVAAQHLFEAVAGDKDIPVNIDVIGVGASAYDQARVLGLKAIAMNASVASRATDKSGKLTFINKRAEWWWKMREALDPNVPATEALALPPDTELLADLCSARWKATKGGIQIEAKDEIKARIGRSPDVGEAIILGFAPETDDAWLEYARQQVAARQQQEP